MSENTSISAAIVVWTGWGRTSWPQRSEQRLIDVYGPALAAELLPRIKQLEDEFYSSDARHTTDTLAQMGERAAEQFRLSHPEISEEAIGALAWCYTFDFK